MSDLSAWIRLSKTGASARRLNGLLQMFGSPEAIFELPPEKLSRDGGVPQRVAAALLDPEHRPKPAEMERIERLQVQLIPRPDPRYPALLAQIHDPPPLLYARGDFSVDDGRSVAIVGSRNASTYGRGMADRLARDLAAAGVTVTSGMARGIDTSAHRGALAAGGRTIAVLGCGLDVPYPWENRALAEQIASTGVLLSEYPMGAAPDAWHFPSRNRIVSGLSLGVVVVEAPKGSGALITAECAADQNREVFAVPGQVGNPRSQGPHALIRDGARLVESVEDILVELRLTPAPAQAELPLEIPDLSGDERAVYALLSLDPKHIDDVIQEAELLAPQVSAALMMLEIKGIARRLPGNSFSRLR